MKLSYALFVSLILTFCLAINGPAPALMMGGGSGGLVMVICGDDGPETVTMGPDGQPVKGAQPCSDCPVCQSLSVGLDEVHRPGVSFAQIGGIATGDVARQRSASPAKYTLPAPRAPPVGQALVPDVAMILMDRNAAAPRNDRDGRPCTQDAFA